MEDEEFEVEPEDELVDTLTEQQDVEQVPAPVNHHDTLPFRELVSSVFELLSQEVRRAGGRRGLRQTAAEKRQGILERFLRRWRSDVGLNVYPALRLSKLSVERG
jgi:hypothetical protein